MSRVNSLNFVLLLATSVVVVVGAFMDHEYGVAVIAAFACGACCSLFLIDGAKSLVIRSQQRLLEKQSKALIDNTSLTQDLLEDVIAVVERQGGHERAVEEMRTLLCEARAKVAAAAARMKTIEVPA